MPFILLALLTLRSSEMQTRVVNTFVGYTLVAGAKVRMTPDQIARRIVTPDRGLQRPDPAGSMLYIWYDRYDVLIVWEVHNSTARDPVRVLRWAGKRIVLK
jgi:hypothetical protein